MGGLIHGCVGQDRVFLGSPGCPRTCSVALNYLIEINFPLLLKCWDYRCASSLPGSYINILNVIIFQNVVYKTGIVWNLINPTGQWTASLCSRLNLSEN